MKRIWKKIMQITNVDNRFTTFPTMVYFSKKFEDKVSTSHEKVHENAIIQNEKHQRAEKWYLRPTIMRISQVVSIQKQSPGGVL